LEEVLTKTGSGALKNGTVTPLFNGGVPMKTGTGIYLPSRSYRFLHEQSGN